MAPAQRICVYCGSKKGDSPAHAALATALGTAIARRGLGLVFGGGHVGLMGVLANAALAGGAEVIGVIPADLQERELAHDRLSQLVVVADMHQRKAAMAQQADAFVALPGGYGTLEELFEMLSWSQLGFHAKPVGLLDDSAYFHHLLAFLDIAVEQQFLRPQHRALLLAERDPETLLDLLQAAMPSP